MINNGPSAEGVTSQRGQHETMEKNRILTPSGPDQEGDI